MPTTITFDPFDPDIDPSNVSTRWKKWVTRFEFCLKAAGITSDDRMVANLINCADKKVFDVYEELTVTKKTVGAKFALQTLNLNTKLRRGP